MVKKPRYSNIIADIVCKSAFILILCVGPIAVQAQDIARPEPEIGTGLASKKAAYGKNFMIATAHPLATEVGYRVLRGGGTAADAAVAVQMMLGLAEPQSSGIGGGAFALYYDAANEELISLDGRETAPALAGKYLFTDQDGQPMDFYDAVIGGRSVGTPGVLKLLEKLHGRYGGLPWESLFLPAVDLAENGFTVTPRLSQMIVKDKGKLDRYSKTRLYFYPDGSYPVLSGQKLRNREYARSLYKIAKGGADVFYKGSLAEKIAKKVQHVPGNPGLLSVEDLANYEAKSRPPVCGRYRLYLVCSMGEPSSGGLTLLQALGMLEKYNLKALGPDNAQSWHLIGEASRLAFVDRNHYMADPDFVKTPGLALLDKTYVIHRADHINPKRAMIKSPSPGIPPGWVEPEQKSDVSEGRSGTSHISIVDSYGNILSMTTTIEGAFGSKLMAEGFLLNNQLTDFSFVPEKDGRLIANRVQSGKRPRSSMAPTIVFDPDGKPFLVIGSAGGSRIIGFVLQRIIAMIDWDMELQEALNAKSTLHRGKHMEVENGAEHLVKPIIAFGHPVHLDDMVSGLTAIHFKGEQIIGAADPRREGIALGD